MEYAVNITETLQKEVKIEAESREQAQYIAEKNWRQGEYILDADDFSEVNFETKQPKVTEKTPDYDEIKTVADYEDKHAVPYSQRQTEWFGDYNMYETTSHYSPENFYKTLTMAYNENQEKEPQTRSNISIRFAKKQIYGEHNVSVNGQDIAYVNVALPKASKYHGYSLSIKKDSIRDDKYSPKMAFFSISDKTYTLSNWDKETKTASKIDLSAKEIQKEFNAWKEKKKDVPTR